MQIKTRRAVFLDRDGVLIKDVDLLTRISEIEILPRVPEALRKIKKHGFFIVVVTNQPVVARGMISEAQVIEINGEIDARLRKENAPALDAWYFCPHHPNATLPEYKIVCQCRKPEAGMLLKAAREHQIDLGGSFMIGDRITDIIAGRSAGCKTILMETGKHEAAPIQTAKPVDTSIRPDFICDGLLNAVSWIEGQP